MAERIIHRLEDPLTLAANPDFAGQELIYVAVMKQFRSTHLFSRDTEIAPPGFWRCPGTRVSVSHSL